MNESNYKYIWRCIKCSNHFTNIHKTEGMLKQEKKCPKCKSINTLTLTDSEIFIHCKFFDQRNNDYPPEYEETYRYPV